MRILRYVLIAIITGTGFWIPSIALHWHRTNTFSRHDVGTLSLLMPVVAIGAYFLVRWLSGQGGRRWLSKAAAVLGIWSLGPLAMMTSATASQGGFAQPDALKTLVFLTAMFPGTTFIMSTYDGSLLAIFLGTVGIILFPGPGRKRDESSANNSDAQQGPAVDRPLGGG